MTDNIYRIPGPDSHRRKSRAMPGVTSDDIHDIREAARQQINRRQDLKQVRAICLASMLAGMAVIGGSVALEKNVERLQAFATAGAMLFFGGAAIGHDCRKKLWQANGALYAAASRHRDYTGRMLDVGAMADEAFANTALTYRLPARALPALRVASDTVDGLCHSRPWELPSGQLVAYRK